MISQQTLQSMAQKVASMAVFFGLESWYGR
jgi:hypothetical protein